jgi:hypothetical protein
MRTAQQKIINVALSEKAIETPILYNDPMRNNVNLSAVYKLLDRISLTKFDKQFGARGVDKAAILELLKNIEVPVSNVRFDPIAVHAFIDQYAGNELDKWDVALISVQNGEPYQLKNGVTINQINRSFDMPSQDTIRMSKKKSRIGSPSDPRFGLSDTQIEVLKSRTNYLSSDAYFRIERNPLLMIYFVNLTAEKNENSDGLADFQGIPLVGFGIGIPKLADAETKYIKYQLTKIYQEFGGIEEYEDE